METWEDCLASLRAGAEPELVLPRIRELFSQLPEKPSGSSQNATLEVQEKAPTENLYHTLEGAGDYVFQVPFLRPPCFLWDAIKEDSGEFPDEHETLFDSELDVDLFSQFQPRFVEPPAEEVRQLLKEQNKFDHPVGKACEGSEDDFIFEEFSDARLESNKEEKRIKQYCADDITGFSRDVKIFLSSANSSHVDSDMTPDAMPRFPLLGVTEWSLVFSGMENSTEMSPQALTRFLLFTSQPSLAVLVLQTIVPFLISIDDSSKHNDALTTLVSSAAGMAELERFSTAEVRELLDIYRGTKAGVLSALAQLHIVSNTKKGC